MQELVEKIDLIFGYSAGLIRCLIAVDLAYDGHLAQATIWKSTVEKPQVKSQAPGLRLEVSGDLEEGVLCVCRTNLTSPHTNSRSQ
jgi:hypothetical protein